MSYKAISGRMYNFTQFAQSEHRMRASVKEAFSESTQIFPLSRIHVAIDYIRCCVFFQILRYR